MRTIEVAVVYTDRTWQSLWVTVEDGDNPGKEELEARALDVAIMITRSDKKNIEFLKVLSAGFLDDFSD